jgi:hypothetical protein
MEKPEEEWTPEEIKLYQAYELKMKELNEEREKLRKQLNSEINKINEQILECYQNFDSQLLALHLRKVKTQQAVYQVNKFFFLYYLLKNFKYFCKNFKEELKVLRLSNSLIVDSELETYEYQLNDKLEDLKEEKVSISKPNI